MLGGRRRVEEACDRISGLPNAVLCHILSFLLTDQAVETSILSKRWRYVWTSVPTINIRGNPWGAGRRHKHSYNANEFMDFVDSVLCLNDSLSLKSFCLFYNFCEDDYDSSRISQWFSSLALRRVEKIELRFDGRKRLLLPLSFFTCNSIVSLKLCQEILVNVPKLVYFPRLKIIQVFSIKLLDGGDAIKNLLAGCPAVEELNISTLRFQHQPYTLHVRSSSLKSLKIETDDYEGIVIDAPNLQHLTLTNYGTVQINMNYQSSLITATLGLGMTLGYSARVGTNVHSRVTDLLRKISNTKYLCLSLDTMECLEHECLDNFPIFHSLNHLVVLIYKHSSRVLSTLLECSPNLISLVIELNCLSRGDLYECLPQLCPPKCWMLYLEKIEVRGFEGTSTEMELVRQLLVNATVFKKMSIWYSSYPRKVEEELQIVKKLIMFPRGSTTCQMEFTDMEHKVV